MKNEDVVDFSLAKKLKDKGFKEYCQNYYSSGGYKNKVSFALNFNTTHMFTSAPTIGEVKKWINAKYKV